MPPRFPQGPKSLEDVVTHAHEARPNQQFQPLPPPTGSAPFRLALADVLTEEAMEKIHAAGRIDFHCVGDTGGLKDPYPQEAVAAEMARDVDGQDPQSFLYHLGDVVYMFGGEDQYYTQFYEPYAHYHAPIFAIPGNHDGSRNPFVPSQVSLAPFVKNFCAPTAHLTPEAEEVDRAAMTQPNVFWTFETPFVNVVGLYTNVPEGGQIGADQLNWLIAELEAAPADRVLIVALHHPIYSGDAAHGSNLDFGKIVHDAFDQAGRWPDAVFSGHVHDYQRFTYTAAEGRQVPHVVAGAGGYHNLHTIAAPADGKPLELPWQTPVDGVTFDAFNDTEFGYMRVSAAPGKLSAEYVAVPRPGTPDAAPHVVDSWSLDTATHKLS